MSDYKDGTITIYSNTSLGELKKMGYVLAGIGNPILLNHTEITPGLLRTAVSMGEHFENQDSIDAFLLYTPQKPLDEDVIHALANDDMEYKPNSVIPIALRLVDQAYIEGLQKDLDARVSPSSAPQP